MGKTRNTKDNKKKILSLALLGLSAVGLVGFSLAYFSDVVNVGGQAKVGTLDLVYCENTAGVLGQTIEHHYADGTLADDYNGIDSEGLALNNVNPGDYVTFDACITNSGNKSAWVRPVVSLTSTSGIRVADFVQQVTVKTPGAATPVSLLDFLRSVTDPTDTNTQNAISSLRFWITSFKRIDITPTSVQLTLSGGTVIPFNINLADNFILNGTGLFAEKEDGAIADDQINLSGYQIGLATTAGNTLQGRDLSVNIKIEALQYRNNPTPIWTEAINYNAE